MSKRKFERFYKKNIDRIYRYVYFRVGQNNAVAEDLVSEIFLKALDAFERYDEKISHSAWIYRIAHNHLANHFRDKKDHTDIDDIAFTLAGEDGRETLEQAEKTLTLRTLLDALSPEDRALVTFKHLYGYTYAEMADIFDRSADALKVATHRAVKTLRTKLVK